MHSDLDEHGRKTVQLSNNYPGDVKYLLNSYDRELVEENIYD